MATSKRKADELEDSSSGFGAVGAMEGVDTTVPAIERLDAVIWSPASRLFARASSSITPFLPEPAGGVLFSEPTVIAQQWKTVEHFWTDKIDLLCNVLLSDANVFHVLYNVLQALPLLSDIHPENHFVFPSVTTPPTGPSEGNKARDFRKKYIGV
ncbi:hypothetical protein PHISP_04058 [Aspergillus sp. HF37]|nr:hypothetical protein PHISP_04058 [Aspergillus sp. HF37]